MPLFRPSELREFLGTLGIQPKRKMSQNFLIDGNIVKKIIEAAHPTEEVLEIGPGPGVLTEALLEVAERVIAVEKDDIFARALSRLDQKDRLQVINADILDCSLTSLVSAKAIVVSNLPYHITTPILEWLVRYQSKISRVVVMMQTEVAHRLMPKHEKSSYLQVLLSLFFSISPVCSVSKHSFYPEPNVDSSVLLLESKGVTEVQNVDLVRQAFSQKRKKMTSSLPLEKEEAVRALKKIHCSESSRPEQLNPSEWVAFLSEITHNA